MDKIWDRKSFVVGGHWPLWRGRKNELPRRTDKSRKLKKNPKIIQMYAIQMSELSYVYESGA